MVFHRFFFQNVRYMFRGKNGILKLDLRILIVKLHIYFKYQAHTFSIFINIQIHVKI
jgi:hypothetical protein